MRDELWCRVDAALDARCSPFEDAVLAAELRADPASEAVVRRLVSNLAHVAAVARARRRGPRYVIVAAAGLLLLAAATLFARRGPRASDAEPASGTEFTLVVQRVALPPARAARIELVPKQVVAWTLEGETP